MHIKCRSIDICSFTNFLYSYLINGLFLKDLKKSLS